MSKSDNDDKISKKSWLGVLLLSLGCDARPAPVPVPTSSDVQVVGGVNIECCKQIIVVHDNKHNNTCYVLIKKGLSNESAGISCLSDVNDETHH